MFLRVIIISTMLSLLSVLAKQEIFIAGTATSEDSLGSVPHTFLPLMISYTGIFVHSIKPVSLLKLLSIAEKSLKIFMELQLFECIPH